jgi:hypothetical protein
MADSCAQRAPDSKGGQLARNDRGAMAEVMTFAGEFTLCLKGRPLALPSHYQG